MGKALILLIRSPVENTRWSMAVRNSRLAHGINIQWRLGVSIRWSANETVIEAEKYHLLGLCYWTVRHPIRCLLFLLSLAFFMISAVAKSFAAFFHAMVGIVSNGWLLCTAACHLFRLDRHFRPVLLVFRGGWFHFIKIIKLYFLCRAAFASILQAFLPRSVVHRILAKSFLIEGKALHRSEVTVYLQWKTCSVRFCLHHQRLPPIAWIVVERTHVTVGKRQNRLGDYFGSLS